MDKRYPNRLFREFCSSRQIPFLDLTGAFEAADSVANLYLTTIEDPHFSAAGHQLAAEEIARFLKEHSVHLKAPAIDSFRLGLYYLDQGDGDKAKQTLLAGIEQHPRWVSLHVALGDVHARHQRWLAAAQAYRQALTLDRESLRAWEGLAEVLPALGDTVGAVAAYRRAAELHPEWWAYHQALQDLYARQGRVWQAEKERFWVEAVFNAPRFVRRHWWAEHVSAAMDYAGKGQWPRAEREFERAMRFMPDEDEADSPETLYTMGLVLQYQDRRKARWALEQALVMKPDFAEAGLVLGMLYEEEGELSKAREILEKVVQDAPRWADAWTNLGYVYVRMEELDQADQAWERALELDPHHPQARANLDRLRQMGLAGKEAESNR